jgi:hypothetical protein
MKSLGKESLADPGLCASCLNARRIESGRGSLFWLCRMSERDPRFPKYPVLPVLSCFGYQKIAESSEPR